VSTQIIRPERAGHPPINGVLFFALLLRGGVFLTGTNRSFRKAQVDDEKFFFATVFRMFSFDRLPRS